MKNPLTYFLMAIGIIFFIYGVFVIPITETINLEVLCAALLISITGLYLMILSLEEEE